MKHCSKCGVDKPFADFYMSRGRPMGHCKICFNAKAASYRENNRSEVQQRDRERNARPDRIAGKEAYRTNKIKQWRAKTLLGYHIRMGHITPWPVCAIPECDAKPEAHHPDYDAQLSVVWLCHSHHMQAHALTRTSP